MARCRPRLLLPLAACGLLLWPPLCTAAAPDSSSAVELRFGGHPGLACADGRAHSTVVVLLVVDAHGRVRRTFGCFFQGDIQQLQAMAAEHGLRVISLQPASVSLAIPEADCVLPAAGLPSGLFDVQMIVLGAAAAPAGCLMYGSSRAGLDTRAADNNHTASGAADGALLIRFQRVSFPVLECRLRAHTRPDVIVRGLVQPPDDHFTCRFRYRIKGQVLGALLRYLSAVYRLPLDTPPAGLPVLALRRFTCGAGAGDDADVDFLVTGPRGSSAGCHFSAGDGAQGQLGGLPLLRWRPQGGRLTPAITHTSTPCTAQKDSGSVTCTHPDSRIYL